ncbi:hypothetical protein F4802DRAFT_111087 [Xylaria palmicola]|nr:hypothetical protein F4802DRAFT_111087 [Xylaria palmicola]
MSRATWGLFRRYDNSHDKPGPFNSQSTVQGIIISFAVISWICVALRIHTRFRLQCLGWDDLFVVIFRAFGTLGTIFILLLFNCGFGKHFWEIGKANQITFQKRFYVCLFSYTIATTLMKLCLLTQYLRLFHDDRRARRVCWFFIALSALWGTGFSVIALVPCVPLSGFWDWMNSNARCYGFGSQIPSEIAGTYAAHVASNVALDLIVLAIPAPLYFQTFRQKKQRIGFSIMILLGILVNVISAWRLHTIIETRAGTYPVVDPTFYGPTSIVLAALEVDLASIVASIPVFWPLLTQGWGTIFVTHEVHVTHHHRRLSGDDHDQLELRSPPPSGRSSRATRSRRASSDGSLKLVIMGSKGQQSSTRASSRSRSASRTGGGGGYDRNDPYVRGRVYPLEGAAVASEAQVVSEGQRGFERNYRERFGALPPAAALDPHRLEEGRVSTEHWVGKDEHGDRSWSISISRQSSRRFR